MIMCFHCGKLMAKYFSMYLFKCNSNTLFRTNYNKNSDIKEEWEKRPEADFLTEENNFSLSRSFVGHGRSWAEGEAISTEISWFSFFSRTKAKVNIDSLCLSPSPNQGDGHLLFMGCPTTHGKIKPPSVYSWLERWPYLSTSCWVLGQHYYLQILHMFHAVNYIRLFFLFFSYLHDKLIALPWQRVNSMLDTEVYLQSWLLHI